MDVRLKRLCREDANRWLNLQRETYEPYLEEYGACESHPAADTIEMVMERLAKPCCHHYFACSGNAIVGGIRITWESNQYEIADLFVLPKFQHKGFGKQIVRMAEALYPDASGWELWTELQAQGNHCFYESLGYKKTEDILRLNNRATLLRFRKER